MCTSPWPAWPGCARHAGCPSLMSPVSPGNSSLYFRGAVGDKSSAVWWWQDLEIQLNMKHAHVEPPAVERRNQTEIRKKGNNRRRANPKRTRSAIGTGFPSRSPGPIHMPGMISCFYFATSVTTESANCHGILGIGLGFSVELLELGAWSFSQSLHGRSATRGWDHIQKTQETQKKQKNLQ